MRSFDRVYAKIHLDYIEENMESMRRNLTPGTKMIGVVKTDGYGHGAAAVAKTIDRFVIGFAVAAPEEGYQLRKHGIRKHILVLGVTPAGQYERMIREEICLSVFTMEQAVRLSETAQKIGKEAKIHIAVDTGMNRIGLAPTEKSADLVKKIGELPGIQIEGMFTHFARADEEDKKPARRQLEQFLCFDAMLKARGVQIPLRHCSNSAGIVDLREADLDAVRAGITVYGLYPSHEVEKDLVPLKPAMELKSFVSYVKEIPAGAEVSYGGTFRAERSMKIATVSIGYGDGYPRNLSGKGQVLICGKRAPIVGRICMDQLMADVTGISGVCEGTEVTLLGTDGEETITMDELAMKSGGFHYEIPCVIGKRVPRIYVSGETVVGTMTYEDGEYEGI